MSKISLHLLSLPHTSTTREYTACAYTSKCRRFADMMSTLGYDIYIYGGPENEAECKEHIVVASEDDQKRWFGDFDYHKSFFPITWGVNDVHWVEMNCNIIREMGKRIGPDDLILITAGVCQKMVADAFPNKAIEWTIGYPGVFAGFRVYESYPWLHYVQGSQKNDYGQFFDAVIPNYFDPNEFEFREKKDDYYVWIGRFMPRKGPDIAVEATRRLGAKLVMAGQGVESNTTVDGLTTLVDQNGFKVSGSHIEHIGHVNIEERSELLAGAKGVFVPTTYLEPFGGVHVEAMMCGTPVITTDFGVFPSTVIHGEVGYRFSTIGEATYFAGQVENLDNQKIRDYAVNNFSMDAVKYKYDDYFQQVAGGKDAYYGDWRGRDNRYSRWLPA